ncbi:ParE-like toxin of type II ParDE toxin-antitoxin system [Anaerobacterium chartisolvens]|uniref:ParE-like toxin of type II ParDE toxin-antitoxin system n=1 Tax=Anaerobacterium chartisolvens TaxID=1297424 RepID=A0A369BFF3_9FIRM|nr:type II toxin-antitoxin system RelE/ParE family toxin [Anaerobacterium chartisolvens]RCX19286.1 ParE-like toxin of type II ParDE toxin-antitoxin system [Anaerobacterium chartisolvens]
MYEIRFTGAAEKYLKKVKEKGLKKAFQEALQKISSDPYIGELKTGDLARVYCYDIYYSKTNYELAYRIYEENGQMVVVILAGTRETFYDELKRYMK